jgi:hypothetical protein
MSTEDFILVAFYVILMQIKDLRFEPSIDFILLFDG